MEHWTEYSRFFVALFVILDPFIAIPLFLALTREYSQAERNRVARMAAITVAIVLIVAALFGEKMLTLMGTSLASFRVGGGLVLLLMALEMLRANEREIVADAAHLPTQHTTSIAIVPIALPLLAGPGSISAVIIQMHRSSEPWHASITIALILTVCLFIWLILRLATTIGKTLGASGLNILNRLFGLILAAIAVEIMANGLRTLFPLLS
jgi:multiple antibiotic resistance protein